MKSMRIFYSTLHNNFIGAYPIRDKK